VASVLLGACGSKPILPNVLTVDVQATANLNPSSSGRPSPVVVRVYELKAAAPFESADFVSLFEKDQATLGGDVVARDEFVLRPGETKAIRRELDVDSKFIAVMAIFRDLERAKWRAVVPLAGGKDNALSIRLVTSTVSIGKQP
jgi:type VI secretion system protein VasD